MTSICVKFLKNGKKWFDGKKINQNFEDQKCLKFGYLYDECLGSDEDTDEESDNESQSYIHICYLKCITKESVNAIHLKFKK